MHCPACDSTNVITQEVPETRDTVRQRVYCRDCDQHLEIRRVPDDELGLPIQKVWLRRFAEYGTAISEYWEEEWNEGYPEFAPSFDELMVNFAVWARRHSLK